MKSFNLLFLLLLQAFCTSVICSIINLSQNKYTNIVIGINPEVQESPELLDNLKNIWTEASEDIWLATKQRAYFGEITVIIPKGWSGSYKAARNITYAAADVIVANANVQYGDMPYTLQYGQCGDPGKYIHLTPNYILSNDIVQSFGPKGKTIVHEWAHLRWGVYDESATEGYDEFYYDTNGKLEATRCPVSLNGENIAIDWKTGEMKPCQMDQHTNWVPGANCTFIPYENQDPMLSSSLMSHQYIDQIFTFCHDDPNDPVNQHNKEAPNEHNRLCNQRSVWDVIMSSADFENGVNSPNSNIASTAPTFKFVQPQVNKFVLVLDISGSMNGKKFKDMLSVANDIIANYISDGSEVAIVQFYSEATLVHDFVEIHVKADKAELIASLPDGIRGLGSIGDGIRMAISTLESKGSTTGSHIVLLTSGAETYHPYVTDVHDEVLSKGVLLSTLIFGENRNADLEALAEETDGVYAFNVNDFSLLKNLFQTYTDGIDGNQSDRTVLVDKAFYKMSINDRQVGSATIDESLGKDTAFQFEWSESWVGGEPMIQLTSPIGEKYCTTATADCSNELFSVDTHHNLAVFEIPFALQGKWEYQITTTVHYQYVDMKITSKPVSSDVPPIIVESSVSRKSVAYGENIIIYSKVSQGYNAVLGAKVQAIINCPDGTTAFLDLNDNGSAPDVRKSDGVYTRYFSSFVGNGQYTVSVNVTGTAAEPAVIAPSIVSPVQYNFGYINSADVVVLNPNGDNTQGQPLPALVQFSRISDAGGFTYSGPIVTTYNDIYAPAKVLDLGAIQVDPLDGLKGIVFSFTSPGDDEDQGTASEYELRYLFDDFDTLSTSFENAFQVDQSMITSGDLMQPKTAGTAESITAFLPNIPADKDNVVIGFAIRAKDDVDNTAAPSNIAIINLFIKPPAIGCIDDYGYPYSGEPFKKPDDCDDFYQCSNGELNMIHCQPGTVFNPVIKVCDHPAMVPECQ